MTMVLTRIKEIADREGFEIWDIRRNGRIVRVTNNGIMGPYQYARKMKGTKTVNEWLNERFRPTYPGITCRVFRGDGTAAPGQTLLQTVRDTYP